MIGLFEAGLIPCIDVYLAWVYKKSERGKRSAVIFAFSAFASAFGGVLAYGLTQIQGPNGFAGWRWLFCVEAAITLILVPIVYVIFPRTPTTAWFLTKEEKMMMQTRYELDPNWGNEDKFNWHECFKAFLDPKFHAFWVYQFCVDVTLYAMTTFMPTIIESLGYASVHANLMTVPVYMVALIWFLVLAYFSDRSGIRWPFLAGPLLCLIIGYAILIGADDLKVRFFACFGKSIPDKMLYSWQTIELTDHQLVIGMGIYPTTGLSLMWMQDNVARHYKRATMVGFTLCFGNTAGVAVGQIFTTETSPRYIKGLSISLGLAVLALVIVLGLAIGMTIVNRRRAAKILSAEQAGTPIEPRPELGDYDVHFKYSI